MLSYRSFYIFESALSVFLHLTPYRFIRSLRFFCCSFLVYIIECAVLNYGKLDRSSRGTAQQRWRWCLSGVCSSGVCLCCRIKRKNENTSQQKNASEQYVFFKPFYPTSN